ncbi:lasso peptide biosynthesis B2 protein [Phenylobacterium kunshanense]|uniref:Lasso peptide biosynthesis B2 protein n=1 Tax=Phenylobacterium kunshanense TaxID=1445034 RepID=A0A328BIZ9_9CAUL|nr:lasso peptide biosynthesis B2 protein [Phenylobacterium kunshanense]RAK66381.1 lasso peptide biosynthesis B2 protein [Phenylobacterium kunshanense]
MTLTLRSDVHAAVVDDDVVVLDIGADDYLCLPGLAPLWRLAVDADGRVGDPDLSAQLRAAGLLGTDHTRVSRAPLPLAHRSACDLPPEPLTFRDRLALTGALWDVLLHYRGRSLTHILRHVRRRGVGPAASVAATVRLSATFAHVLPWLPLPAKCLVRSFALLCFLQRRGQDAHWCFGVRTWPFSAHCWLQVGDVALDDHADQLRAYTTIHVA